MKLIIKEKGKDKVLDVEFWSFFKGVVLSYIVMAGLLFAVGFIIGVMLW